MKISTYKQNNIAKNYFPSLFFFIVIMFIPKFDLIPVPGYWQGIRIEDLLILSYFVVFISNTQNVIYHREFLFKNFLIFFIYIFVSNLIAILSGIEVKILMLIRLSEYIVLLYFFDNFNLNLTKIKKILYYYLIINFIIALLQYLKLVGNISSLGYLGPEDVMSLRSMGLTGGSWELGAISSIIFFTIIEIEKNVKKIFLVFCLVNLLLIFAEGRGNFVGFNLATLFLFLFNNKIKLENKIFFVIVIIISIFIFKNYLFKDFFEKIFLVDYNYLRFLFSEGIFNNNLPSKDQLIDMKIYLSFWYRVRDWSIVINELTDSNINIFFGLGLKDIYYDSLLIRILVSTGIFGIILVLFLTLKLKLYLMIFFLFSGAFLDLFISMKIFFFTLIMLYVHKRVEKLRE